MIWVREKLLNDFEAKLEFFKTYPPLAAFILKYFQNMHMHRLSEEPGLIEQRYMVEFHNACDNQSKIEWRIFVVALCLEIGDSCNTAILWTSKQEICMQSINGHTCSLNQYWK